MDNFNNKWFERMLSQNADYETLVQNPIAYFCAEFGLSDIMPIYSGGLGILAGDTIKEADQLGIPLVGVGLLYKQGFFKQQIDDNDNEQELPQPINPRTAGLSLVLNSEGNVFTQSIPVFGREIHFQTWKLKVGSIDMYFLDTDIELNTEYDRGITQTLYGGDIYTRILQEIILGIGGEKSLYSQGIYPSIYHMNEGHSAFAALGIAHHLMKSKQCNFPEAMDLTKKKLIFTNHTLVPAGNDLFLKQLVIDYLHEYADEAGLPLQELVEKGATADGKLFSMTIFALNVSNKVNAVSQLHYQKAIQLWPNYPMSAITNGVNLKTWIHPDMWHLFEDIMLEHNVEIENSVDFLSKAELWKTHQSLKEQMLKEIFNITGSIFDPNILTITWARRLAAYKRPDLIFLDMERLKKLLTNIQKPVQIIMSGKPHPKDDEAKGILKNILDNIKKIDQPNRIVFIPNYSMSLAKILVSGSDVWLNNPLRGFEACGTSGMKAGANGVLQFSVKDGWVDEVDWHEKGFVIDENDSATSLYSQLENDISTLYYQRENNMPEGWINMMINTMNLIVHSYSSKRMLLEYFTNMYLPTLKDQKATLP
jgi:starch phosphorylase